MNKAKDKAIIYLKERHDINYTSSPQRFSFNTEVEIAKALDIAIQEAKKEFFDDIEKYRVKTGCILINQSTYWILKAKHLNTNNTENKNKED